MSLPFTRTTVSISRPDETADPEDGAAPTSIDTGVPAVVGQPSGRARIIGGVQQTVDAQLWVNPGVNIQGNDTITDAYDGSVYTVVWLLDRPGRRLGHITAGLQRVTGAANG